MSRKNALLCIKLKSDLCAGSGYSYEGVVDTDICFNENGIPYIPGKRIKGCLREAAELIRIGEEQLGKIFGTGGYHDVRGIQVGNAFPKGSEALDQELSNLKEAESEYKEFLSPQNVLAHYSHVHAQTRIDALTGTAQQDTLRFTRVVNQYTDKKEQEFVAHIAFDCENQQMEKIVKALRHMGMDRNRGLGNVKCSLENIVVEKASELSVENGENENEPVELRVILKNIQPLMLSMNDDGRTENYIGGQTLLGALAGAYICGKGYSDRNQASDDPVFKDLFLNGTTVYSNLYITKKDGDFKDYVPAPQFLKTLKKTKVFVNVARDMREDEAGNTAYKENDDKYQTAGGNIPKKLNGKFVHIAAKDNKISLAEPVTEIVFHHSRGSAYDEGRSQEKEKGILYTMNVLERNQYFSGTIHTVKKYENVLKKLLEQPLYLGKSRTAQYGLCRQIGEPKAEPYTPVFHGEKGEQIIVALESDAIFMNDYGYTIRYEEIRRKIAEDLKIKYEEKDKVYSALETKVVCGYNTMWNLKKPSVPALRAGSVISYKLSDSCTITTEYTGEKNLEGFGKVRIYHAASLPNIFEEEKIKKGDFAPKESKEILKEIMKEELLSAMIERAFDEEDIGISGSTLGRLTLMLEESLNRYGNSYGEAFEDLKKRVASIQRMQEKNKIFACMRNYIGEDKKTSSSGFKADTGEHNVISVKTLVSSKAARKIYETMEKLYGEEGKQQLDEDVKALWGEYFMQLLICQKYKKAEARR